MPGVKAPASGAVTAVPPPALNLHKLTWAEEVIIDVTFHVGHGSAGGLCRRFHLKPLALIGLSLLLGTAVG